MNKEQLRQIIREVVHRKIAEANLDPTNSDSTAEPINPTLQQAIDDTSQEIEDKRAEVTKLKGRIADLHKTILNPEQRAARKVSNAEKKLGVLIQRLETLMKKAGRTNRPTKPTKPTKPGM